MVKSIYYLLLCSMLLLYCCAEHNLVPKKNNQENGYDIHSGAKTNDTQDNALLTSDEQQKFDTLIHAFNKIIINNKQLNIQQKEQYKKFEDWLLQDVKRQKELADHFKYLYYFLDKKKPQTANNITIKQLVGNTIDCVTSDTCDGRNDVYSYYRPDSYTLGEQIKSNFEHLLSKIINIPDSSNINEEMFQTLKSELIFPNNYLVQHIINEIDFLKLRFNDNQIKILNNYVSPYLSRIDGEKYTPKYSAFIKLSDSTIKPVLDHIYNELLKCNGNQQSINNFKNNLKTYFDTNEINNEAINQLPNKVTIKCSNNR